MVDVENLIPVIPVVKNPDLGVEVVSKKFEEDVESIEKNCRRYSDIAPIHQEGTEKPLRDISIRKKLSTTTRRKNEFKVSCDDHEKTKFDRETNENKRGRGAGDTSGKVKYKKKPAVKQGKNQS